MLGSLSGYSSECIDQAVKQPKQAEQVPIGVPSVAHGSPPRRCAPLTYMHALEPAPPAPALPRAPVTSRSPFESIVFLLIVLLS